MIDFRAEAQGLFDYSSGLRRGFHRHPELAFEEVRSAGIIAQELRQLGLHVTTGVAVTGVVAIIEGNTPGPVVLLRFDMDALPVQEETGAPYASEVPGKMHACGHDAHMAIGLTVAKMLAAHRGQLRGCVKLVFQPAEETGAGAQRMVEEGVLDTPVPARSLALHVWNGQPLGWLGIAPGPVMATAAAFTVTLTGKGGHGAMPQLTRDPIVAAAHVITALQSIASRNVDPQKAAVVSVCAIRGGDAFNVIPATVELKGTIRAFEPEVQAVVYQRVRRCAAGVARGLGCEASTSITTLTQAVINDPMVTRSVMCAARATLPDHEVDERGTFTMGGEDFSALQAGAPGTFFFVGSANAAKGLTHSHHHPQFDFDEAVLSDGAALMAAAAVQLLDDLHHSGA